MSRSNKASIPDTIVLIVSVVLGIGVFTSIAALVVYVFYVLNSDLASSISCLNIVSHFALAIDSLALISAIIYTLKTIARKNDQLILLRIQYETLHAIANLTDTEIKGLEGSSLGQYIWFTSHLQFSSELRFMLSAPEIADFFASTRMR